MAWRMAARGALEEAVEALRARIAGYRTREIANSLEAVSVAYILIRAGRFDLLEPRMRELPGSRSVPADAIVVAAEWFAHAGCHLSAFNLLRELPNVGVLPLFSDGFSLALARLTAYASLSINGPGEFQIWENAYVASLGRRSAGDQRRTPATQARARWSHGSYALSEQKLSPWSIGQELTASNVLEAQRGLEPFAHRAREVDWS